MKAAYTAKSRSIDNLSNSSTGSSSDGYVVLFLIIPGLNDVTAGCAMLVGRLLQESIDRVLTSQALLVPEPQFARPIMDAMQKDAAARLEGIRAIETTVQYLAAPLALSVESMDGLIASRDFIEDVAERLYGGSLLSFVRHADQFYYVFSVTDSKAGLPAVEAEIKRLGFLQLAEISHYDSEAGICRMHYPKRPATPLTLHCVEVLKGAGLLPR